jgi:predicted DNA-binding protein (MmcQ/YjbR family)
MAKRQTTRDRVRAFAFALPEAYEDHPWGESVAKVAGKVFVFFGTGADGEGPGMGVKLADSNAQALMIRDAEPMGYGLGKSGWVSIPFAKGAPPLGVLTDWVEESYRLVAPKRITKALDDPESRQDKHRPRAKKAGVR